MKTQSELNQSALNIIKELDGLGWKTITMFNSITADIKEIMILSGRAKAWEEATDNAFKVYNLK